MERSAICALYTSTVIPDWPSSTLATVCWKHMQSYINSSIITSKPKLLKHIKADSQFRLNIANSVSVSNNNSAWEPSASNCSYALLRFPVGVRQQTLQNNLMLWNGYQIIQLSEVLYMLCMIFNKSVWKWLCLVSFPDPILRVEGGSGYETRFSLHTFFFCVLDLISDSSFSSLSIFSTCNCVSWDARAFLASISCPRIISSSSLRRELSLESLVVVSSENFTNCMGRKGGTLVPKRHSALITHFWVGCISVKLNDCMVLV